MREREKGGKEGESYYQAEHPRDRSEYTLIFIINASADADREEGRERERDRHKQQSGSHQRVDERERNASGLLSPLSLISKETRPRLRHVAPNN